MLMATWAARGLFKGAALVGAFVLLIALWLWDASVLTTAADENLRLVKLVAAHWGCRTNSSKAWR